MREVSDCALVLLIDVVVGQKGRVELAVTSDRHGPIINLEEDFADNLSRRCAYVWRFKVIKHRKMVDWYDPGQLARTAIDVLISTIFGRHSDYRLMEALVDGTNGSVKKKSHYDYTHAWKHGAEGPEARDEIDPNGASHTEFWIDYVGDVGDGWDSTYAIAHYLAQPKLEIANFDAGSYSTKRGDVLIFGGDQVYPAANRTEYRERLAVPYEAALCSTSSPHPHVYAIPGNHDWYDSLVSFTRLFCQHRWFGGWQTNQSRSYFALKLPGRWWLLGTDVQLDSDIDVPQVDYFRDIASQMADGDRVIICTAEPHWVYASLYGKDDANFNENNLAFLEKKVIGDKAKVRAFIAGDQHHYRRYVGVDGTQKITAGGGGAFLHPTHAEEKKLLEGDFELQPSGVYPPTKESRKLGRKNLWFPRYNRKFGVLTALLYVLTAWTVMADVGKFGLTDIWRAIKRTLATALVSPGAVFWMLAIFVGFLLFTDTHSKRYRIVAGSFHGLTHLVATFFIGWTAAYISVSLLHPRFGQYLRFSFKSPGQLIFSAIFIFIFGWLIGSLIMGLYLYISVNRFGRHANEAFSSLAIPDYKNFLRIRIDVNPEDPAAVGALTIFPIGIQCVPREWKRQPENADGPAYISDDNRATRPHLIERPIKVTAG
jgi:hypothetical protein